MEFDYKSKFNYYYDFCNKTLEEFFSKLDKNAPSIITEAMRYSVFNGGKRIRAILCLATADILSIPLDAVKEYIVAIECIHAYSLVHDDLPAMDNDDYRRGKLSTHKKFGEANGILTGDALLNFAFEVCLNKLTFSSLDAKALYRLANLAGYSGMIAGQVYDLESENNKLNDEKTLFDIIINKTAKLITAPLLISSSLANDLYVEELTEFGKHLGMLFQIVDDIMDVEGTLESIGKTPHKDEQDDKLTSVKFYGLDGAKKRAEYHYHKCLNTLSLIPNSQFLVSLTEQMYLRRK